MTVEGPSQNFQIIRDIKDTLLILNDSEFFSTWKSFFQKKLEKSSEISTLTKKFNHELLQDISKNLKLREKQVSRIFDILLLLTLKVDDHMMKTAYGGYLRRKLEKLTLQIFVTQSKTKHLEFEGEMEDVDYKQLSTPPQDCKN